jgi:hypothetical protein
MESANGPPRTMELTGWRHLPCRVAALMLTLVTGSACSDAWKTVGDGMQPSDLGMPSDASLGPPVSAKPSGLNDLGSPGGMARRSISLKTVVAGAYVSADNGGGGAVYVNRFVAGDWETFDIVAASGQALQSGALVQISTRNGQYLSAKPIVTADVVVPGATERYTLSRVAGPGPISDGDQIALQTSTGSYLSAVNGGESSLVSTASSIGDWERFVIGPPGGLPSVPPPGWTLTWADEFDGPVSSPDSTKWTLENSGSGFGDGELEFYIPRDTNVRLDGNGLLEIWAHAESFGGQEYTSARMTSKLSQAYGRFEAGIQIASGKGIWPMFWLLGANIGTVPWPGCGELDIMDVDGSASEVNYGKVHGPGYSGAQALSKQYPNPGGSLTATFHTYAIEWEPSAIRWYIDDQLYEVRTPADLPKGGNWVFDHPFYVLLDVAVGGDFPGSPDGSTVFPQVMKVDYVRVYRKS